MPHMFTDEQIRIIRRRYVKGMGGVLAREYGTTYANIHVIVAGKSYKHVI